MDIKYVAVKNKETGEVGRLPATLLDSVAQIRDRFDIIDERYGCVDCGTAPEAEAPEEIEVVLDVEPDEEEEETQWL